MWICGGEIVSRKDDELVVHQIAFGFGGTTNQTPPEGFPVVAAEWVYTRGYMRTHREGCEEERVLNDVRMSLGLCGLSLYISVHRPPGRQMTQAARASLRVKKMQRRMEQKFPLYAEEMAQREIVKRPEYYAGVNAGQERQDELLAAERERWARWKKCVIEDD